MTVCLCGCLNRDKEKNNNSSNKKRKGREKYADRLLLSLPQHLTVAFSVFFCLANAAFTAPLKSRRSNKWILADALCLTTTATKKKRHFSVFAISKKKKEKLVHHEIKS